MAPVCRNRAHLSRRPGGRGADPLPRPAAARPQPAIVTARAARIVRRKRRRKVNAMQVVLHIGAHATDDDRLLKCLLKNAATLRDRGTMVPGPSRYRKLLRETLLALTSADPAPDTREILLDSMIDGDEGDRLILSNESFVCLPHRIFDGGVFYRLMGRRLATFAQLFERDALEVHMAIRNPASFVPAVFGRVRNQSFEEFMQGANAIDIRWSELLARMTEAVPGASVTVWCNEDTPLIWGEVVREVAGLEPTVPITGGFDLLADIMSDEGMARFRSYLKSHPPSTEVQKRRIIAAFLDKFALEDAIEEELDLPGWTDELVDRMTALYEEDLHEIARMPGVQFIAP